MDELWHFARRHPFPIFGIAIAATSWTYGLISGAHEIATVLLDSLQWQLIGAAIFIMSVLAILFHWDTSYSENKFKPTEHREELRREEKELQIYEGAHEKLMKFVVEHLLPTCGRQESFQAEIIGVLCHNAPVAALARSGLRHNWRVVEYVEGRRGLDRLCVNPPEFIPFDQMIESVAKIEKGYRDFVGEAAWLRRSRRRGQI